MQILDKHNAALGTFPSEKHQNFQENNFLPSLDTNHLQKDPNPKVQPSLVRRESYQE